MNIQRTQSVTNTPGVNVTFIVLGISQENSDNEKIIDFAANFSALIRSMNNRFPDSDFSAILGFSSNAWDILFPNEKKPKELAPFKEIKGKKYTAVSTPGDLFFHIRAKTQDICFEFASIINSELKDTTYYIDETHGFRYFDGRAIIGFVDGTENPESIISEGYALVGDEDPDFKGGSYAFLQKYTHDMHQWNALSEEEQEKIIGRRKYNDLELDDAHKPGTAHNVVSKAYDEEGNELKIVRANVAYSYPSKNEYGTMFIGYAKSFSVTNQMLEHMFLGDDEGNLDSLLDYSTAVTGTLFFIPSLDFLDDLGDE
ncbi:MAG: Dyp-type peroxidase [Neisseriaceae bacterium]|nr:Dyp-type peroxidase [Neisseriaceae bacterium]